MPKHNLDSGDWRTDADAFEGVVSRGFEAAVRDAVNRHHRDGRSVPVWQDGRLVYLNPDGSTSDRDPTPPDAED